MLSPPAHISDEEIADVVATHWLPEVTEVCYLPWGFGAHHWRAAGGGTPKIVTAHGLRLVDWESLTLAPAERDYADLLSGVGDSMHPDPAMVALFSLDWRMSEIAGYARWFAASHTGTDDDHTALAGLYKELTGDSE